MTDRAVVTCALTGVLTDPEKHPVPVTVEEMAEAARGAFAEGAVVMHCHFRMQEPGMGRYPSWEPAVAAAITDAIRAACPGVLINMSTGVLGADVTGPLECLRRTRPELAALNAGSLNYLKATKQGTWAWPPLLFDNPVEKVETMLAAMRETGALPELECFDLGIVRSVGLYQDVGMLGPRPDVNYVMGVASGMPADPDLLPLLLRHTRAGSPWQVTAIGREEVWPLHRRAAELGGHLRTGLEDTFYLPDGSKARSNAELIAALVRALRATGREPASCEEARRALGVQSPGDAAGTRASQRGSSV